MLGIYAQVYRFGFANLDDDAYVSENPVVLKGLTLNGMHWAFTTGQEGNWAPLTWLSLMLDVQLFGVMPGALHVVNVALHLANSLLLFAVLHRMTRALWPSWIVAVLFALHPLHVESVVWISERKDVLSTFFWFLSLGAYVRYVESRSVRWYVVTGGLFCAGLLAKSMLVTLPFLLLLLDFWPLGRMAIGADAVSGSATSSRQRRAREEKHGRRPLFARSRVQALVIEKIPLIAITIVFSALAYSTQQRGHAIVASEALPPGFALRMRWWRTRATSCLRYGRRISRCSTLRSASAALATGRLRALSRRRVCVGTAQRPGAFLRVGRMVLVPRDTGSRDWNRADRRPGTRRPVYVCSVDRHFHHGGLGWTRARSTSGRPDAGGRYRGEPCDRCVCHPRVCTDRSVEYEREALDARRGSDERQRGGPQQPRSYLGGKWKETAALEEFHAAVRIAPDYADAHNNLGAMLGRQGRREEAAAEYRIAVRYDAQSVGSHRNLGMILLELDRTDEAIVELTETARLDPASAPTRYALGIALSKVNRNEEAVAQFADAVEIAPGESELHYHLGIALIQSGRSDDALAPLGQAIRLKPDYAEAYNDRGVALMNLGRRREAIADFDRALTLEPDLPDALENIRAAQPEPAR